MRENVSVLLRATKWGKTSIESRLLLINGMAAIMMLTYSEGTNADDQSAEVNQVISTLMAPQTTIRAVFSELRKLQEVLGPALALTVPFLKQLSSGLPESCGPETAVNGFLQDLDANLVRIKPESLQMRFKALGSLLTEERVRRWVGSTFSRHISAERERLGHKDQTRRYLEYLDNLERDLPFATAVVAMGQTVISPNGLSDLFRLIHLNAKYLRTSPGEQRADVLRQLAVQTTEHFHRRFVCGLHAAERLRASDSLDENVSYGVMLSYLRQRQPIALKPLVLPESAHIRNACSHYDGWVNGPSFDRVTLTDKHRDPAKTWVTTLSQAELYSKLDQLAQEMVALFRATHQKLAEILFDVARKSQAVNALCAALGAPLTPVPDLDAEVEPFFEPLRRRAEVCSKLGPS